MSGEEDNKVKKTRWIRSVVCGCLPFIPDSEYEGEDCELTCNVKKDEP